MGIGGSMDGPGVVRRMASLAELAADPRARGLLGPLGDGALPASIATRTSHDGVRVASINIHMATPHGWTLDPVNEHLPALRDVARLVRAVDPDVVFVQELRNRPVDAAVARGGVGDVASTLGRFVDADDMAFTPAIAQDPFTTPHQHYGTAIYTRNGFTIDQAINARLPTSTPDVELRSVGIAAIRPPDGRAPFTALGTHLANRVVEDQALRDAQLAAIVELSDQVAAGGRVAYVDALGGRRQLSRAPFPGGRQVLAGDHNQEQAASDAIIGRAGFVHANDLVASPGDAASAARAAAANVDTSIVGAHRIDHVHLRGARASDTAVGATVRHEFDGDATDHHLLSVDVPEGA